MNNLISEMILPDGKKIFYLNREEVEFLYERMPNYLNYGISLEPENTVFDVGANIGMFSLMCCARCDNRVNIFAFEPIPQIFAVLQLNARSFNSDKIRLYVTVPEGYATMRVSVLMSVFGNRDGADKPNRLALIASVR